VNFLAERQSRRNGREKTKMPQPRNKDPYRDLARGLPGLAESDYYEELENWVALKCRERNIK